MIYSFFDTELEYRKGLGNFIIMDHILRAAKAGLPYVYLGYWVEGSQRMQYKIRYRPLERLSRNGWTRFDPQEQEQELAQAARQADNRNEPALPRELAAIFRK